MAWAKESYTIASYLIHFDGKPVTCSMDYGSYVGVPCSISLQMLAHGEIPEKGVVAIEMTSSSPQRYFEEFEKRGAKLIKQEPC